MQIDELRALVSEQRSITIPLEFRAATDGSEDFTLEGHAAVFDQLSEDLGGFRERIKRGAFRKALENETDVVLLYNHDQILARTGNGTLELREDPKGLAVSAKVAPTSYARDLRILMENRTVSQMSFAFSVAKDGDHWERMADGTIEREVREVNRLRDVSVVDRPAYPQTAASMRGLDDVTAEAIRQLVAQLVPATVAEPEAEAENRDDADGGDCLPAIVRLALAEYDHH